MKVLLYTVFKDPRKRAPSLIKSNASVELEDEVRSLKAEQCSPCHLELVERPLETPIAGAAQKMVSITIHAEIFDHTLELSDRFLDLLLRLWST